MVPWTFGNLWAHGQQVVPDWHFNPSLYQLSGCEGRGTAEIEDFTVDFTQAEMAVEVGANIHGGGAAEEAADDRTQTVAFRRLTLMLFRHRS
ncbi:hypothetical protein HID58_008236 [Brassica napus]|uniref:Uncharacterized protein n=1 Tax=Brassica napus TaxID=3708 RepID=A0ABQ8DP25_BRANA|nr:hypothetical protein HID58_008236 [Brassica napus]